MNYHLSDHIYMTQFREEMILLDAKADKYTICLKQLSDVLTDILKSPKYFSEDSEFIQKLLDDKIIIRQESPYPFHIDCKSASEGVSNVDWRLPLENKKVRVGLHVIGALITLIKVNAYMQFRGFYATLQLIKKSRKRHSIYVIPKAQELRDLANIVNKACLMYPTRTKCLEWAITFVLLALKRQWKCNLEIGVQNYPFAAHAWVECNGNVVMDSQDLREGLAIILNEPFRKLKI